MSNNRNQKNAQHCRRERGVHVNEGALKRVVVNVGSRREVLVKND